jgi:predicted acetyltransferase
MVRELVYDTAADLLELLRFLHLQADQIDRVKFYTQDEFLFYLFHDPRNDTGNLLPQVYHETNTQGVGIMYRVVNVSRLFEVLKDHNFGHVSCKLKIVLADSFFPENAGKYVVHFQNGLSSLADDDAYDVEILLDVSEFSSLVVGAVDFKSLFEYDLVSLSDESYVDTLDRLFAAPKPICFTEF